MYSDYKILSGQGTESVEKDIIYHLRNGWVLVGGISMATVQVDKAIYTYHAQAVAKIVEIRESNSATLP